jgi:hypothetical protein
VKIQEVPRVDLRLGWTNDQFNVAVLHRTPWGPRTGDDNGLTNDITGGATVRITDKDHLSIDARHRMVTERKAWPFTPTLRTDQLEIGFTYGHRFDLGHKLHLELDGTAGVNVTGNIGGAKLQDGFHALVLKMNPKSKARRLGDTLQWDYEGSAKVTPAIGAAASFSYDPKRWLTARAMLGYRFNPGGLDIGTAGVAVNIHSRPSWRVKPFVEAGVSAIYQRVQDERLGLPGGYVEGVHVSPFATTGINSKHFGLSISLRANEGGNGFKNGVGSVDFRASF